MTRTLDGFPKLYVVGPMSGVKDKNMRLFEETENDLLDRGYPVQTPFMFEQLGVDWNEYLALSIKYLLTENVECLVFLPGWQFSRGALIEFGVATSVGLPCLSWPDMCVIGAEKAERDNPLPLTRAGMLVHGERQHEYGHPSEDFSRIAAMWSPLFGIDVKPEQVALAQICVKLSRLVVTPGHYDSIVDIAGYAETYEMVRRQA